MGRYKRSSLELFHLKQQLRDLEQFSSTNSSTSLVSLYIPPKTKLSDITQKIRDELGTAVNIKDKKTAKAVSDALRQILARMQYLKNGENGLVIFSGNTLETGKEYYAIEPPDPVTIKDYICDSKFHIEHLKDMLEQKDQLGIIVIDRGGATFATIRGSYLDIIDDQTSFVPGKHGRGGQSAGRIERGIEILAREFYSKMARKANQIFLEERDISALVVGGPAMSKDEFIEHPTLDYRLKEKIYKVYDVGYTGEIGIRELLSRADKDLLEYSMITERNLFQQFLKELAEEEGKAIYGKKPILKAFEASAVDILLFSEAIELMNVKIKCSNCRKEFVETATPIDFEGLKVKIKSTPCPKCGKKKLAVKEKKPLIQQFEELALETGAKIEVISMGHEDGQMLYKTFGGLAAILRFPIEWEI
ncbi:MAG: peptide chain release factor aRF-1 [Candidatus Heimdallarchaeota archaeon]|nr:peptide chain release factor aRF-1 [Candidatus Heimdallarchaeota archaeon]